jgi:endonuclease G
MVSPRLFMTNNHVIADSQTGAACSVQFDYQLGIDDIPEVVTEFRLDPATFFWTSADDDLDISLIAVGPRTAGDRPLAHFGWTALSSAGDKHAEGDHVTLIEHPDGDYKQIALRENRVLGRGKKNVTLYYTADTLHGSSGSPVFNDEYALVALHHAGGPRNDTVLDNGQPVPADCNEGIRVSAIVEALRRRHDTLPAGLRDLLAETLNPPAATTPLESAPPLAENPLPAPPFGIGGGTTVPGLVTADLHLPLLRVSAAGAADAPIVLGIEHTVTPTTMGADAGVGPVITAAPATPTTERNDAPGQNYDTRVGYDAAFLSVPVPVPTIPAKLLTACAAPTGQKRSKVSVLLPYTHFSLVVHAERRMPLFTIVNVDGERVRSVNRRTGEVEAAETWFVDPRLDAGHQLDQDVFDAQRPRLFDRGHMVRRLDPAWGSPSTAKFAADDTFHFTNCCPQIAAFNEHLWQGIENYALDNAGTEKRRITVITGPVLGSTDPPYRTVTVPRAFWKIVVRVSDTDSALRATGFLADQNEALDAALSPEEAFADLGKVAAYQTTITTIENLTGLSFGLTKYDTGTAGVKLESLHERTELQTLDGITW